MSHFCRSCEEAVNALRFHQRVRTDRSDGRQCSLTTSPGNSDRVSIGRPIANTQLYVVDSDLNPVPVGVVGELCIGGVGLARGYLNRPSLTAERFVANPYGEPGKRMYRTGDLARYFPDGNLEFIGRADHQVKIRGYRIELGEIEAALLECAGVKQVVVLAREDEPGEKRLVGYVVGDEGTPLESEVLRAQLKNSLPDYMVPSLYVQLERLPLTPNGKVDRDGLPAPDVSAQIEEGYVAPRTPMEQKLAEVWADVLKLPRVGVNDNFFELGGHSLLAMRVVSQLREIIGVELPLSVLFQTESLAALAQRIEELAGDHRTLALPELVGRSNDERLPLSFAQERMWFLEQLGLSGTAYTIPMTLRLVGVLDEGALERSCAELVRRHESLRTRFESADGLGMQIIDEAGGFELERVDLAGTSDSAQEEQVQRRVSEAIGERFDLAKGPLFRVLLIKLGDRKHVLLVRFHHIISDGWSMSVLVRELEALYGAYVAGRPSPLPELDVQYADYALWQREWLSGEVLDKQLSYWKQNLAGAPAALELPTDRPRPAMPSFAGSSHRLRLSAELTSGLRELCRREGATLFMVLMAAYQLVLSRWSGQKDIVVGSPIAGRTHRQLEGMIGFFINTLVFRSEVSSEISFREFLGRVKEGALSAYTHQDLPFERLVQELQPQRDLSRQPIFQTMFAFQNIPSLDFELSGIAIERMELGHATSKFDLSLAMYEESDGLHTAFEYATELFDEATVARLAGHYRQVLEQIVERPDSLLSELDILTPGERHQLLVEWNDTATEYSNDACIHELFEAQVKQTPDAVAVVFEDERLTYEELNQRANQLAHYLREQGVGPDVIVGLCIERSLEMIVGILGILKAGGAYLPLDPEYPAARINYMLEDAHVDIAVSRFELSGKASAAVRIVNLDADRAKIARYSVESPASTVRAGHLAYVIYTSGSTGKPKGVMIEHCELVAI